MISVLIPTYNFDVTLLVAELNNQFLKVAVEYEIVCQDDASQSELIVINEQINEVANCYFSSNKSNLGRAENRNSLARKAKYSWLLFLDCDTFPTQNNFVKKYLEQISKSKVVFGGIEYRNEKPKNTELLRWIYGRKREAISVLQRIENPYKTALTSNLLIEKDTFLSVLFDSSFLEYGYEDYLFFARLEENKIQISHLENPVFHLGLDTSKEFLEKTKIACENLQHISEHYPKVAANNKIIKVYKRLDNFRILFVFNYFFKIIQPRLKANLLSKNPSLFIFDLYKLGWFATNKKQ